MCGRRVVLNVLVLVFSFMKPVCIDVTMVPLRNNSSRKVTKMDGMHRSCPPPYNPENGGFPSEF